MKHPRIYGSVAAVIALTAAVVLYTAHPVKSSDHQDTFNLATRSNTSADITDVFVFPAPDNPNNVVFAMNVSPLVKPLGVMSPPSFDPTVMWQFKISHQASGVEDQVIQLGVTGTGPTQRITMYGPGKPNEIGTTNTFIGTTAGTTTYGQTANLQNNTIQLFAGPRADPFFFDLFAFFTFLGDRNWGTHGSQSDPGPESATNPLGISNGNSAPNIAALTPTYDKTQPPTTPSFNGYAAGTTSNGSNPKSPLGNYACSTNPASDILLGFNVLTYVVEVPKSLITNAGGPTIHVWATANSSTGS